MFIKNSLDLIKFFSQKSFILMTCQSASNQTPYAILPENQMSG